MEDNKNISLPVNDIRPLEPTTFVKCMVCGDIIKSYEGIVYNLPNMICDKCKDAIMQIRRIRERQSYFVKVYRNGEWIYDMMPTSKEGCELLIEADKKRRGNEFVTPDGKYEYKIEEYKGDLYHVW